MKDGAGWILGVLGQQGQGAPCGGAPAPPNALFSSLIQRSSPSARGPQGLDHAAVGFHVSQVGPWAEQRLVGGEGKTQKHGDTGGQGGI